MCDNFLTDDQLLLDELEWQALQANWAAADQATECTQSQTLGNIKEEIEKLCSITKCHYPTQKKIIDGLNKIQSLGKDQ